MDLTGGTYDRLEFKDSASFGLSVGTDVSSEGALEVLWSHQATSVTGRLAADGTKAKISDVNADQFLFDGLYLMGDEKLRPFVLAGVGATTWNPTGNYESVMRFSWALGGGLKYYMSQRFGIRLDARWVPTLVESNNSVFCVSNGGAQCNVTSSGQLVNQFEFAASAILRFGASNEE